ncbi:hypothetical protein [Streptomyces lydicus]|uniref:hypothetical protein n=1 Tax=Streptomyces lydicus TaxID=47763 RepID=UPI0037AE9CA9
MQRFLQTGQGGVDDGDVLVRPPATHQAHHGFGIPAIDAPALPEVLAELAAARADETDADTINRELSIARKAIGWWQRQGWIIGDPTIGIEWRPAPRTAPRPWPRIRLPPCGAWTPG